MLEIFDIPFDEEVTSEIGSITASAVRLSGLKIRDKSQELEDFKNIIYTEQRILSLEDIKDAPQFRAYRDFYWRLGIDPTKKRPATEALTRRIIGGKPLPQINTFVDAYNLASVITKMSIAAFDKDYLSGNLSVRWSCKGESMKVIGGEQFIFEKPYPVIVDDDKIIAIYPYRDSDETKITDNTENAVLIICGAPGMDYVNIRSAAEVAAHTVMLYNT